MRRLLVWIILAAVMSGCDAVMPGRTRPISMEMEDTEGLWQLDGIQKATLRLNGWEICIVESEVNAVSKVPLLEKLVLEITNTSLELPLILEPKEITITGAGNRAIFLGPPETVVLQCGRTHRLVFAPGMRADLLPYPFTVRVTVFRGVNFKGPQSVTLTLY